MLKPVLRQLVLDNHIGILDHFGFGKELVGHFNLRLGSEKQACLKIKKAAGVAAFVDLVGELVEFADLVGIQLSAAFDWS
jgi:hypothetical protein